MVIFSVSKKMTYGEVADLVDWCLENCSGHFYMSPIALMNPMALMYHSYIKHQWPELRAKWTARANEIFTTFGFPSYIIFDKPDDATLFKLSFGANDICFLCHTFI